MKKIIILLIPLLFLTGCKNENLDKKKKEALDEVENMTIVQMYKKKKETSCNNTSSLAITEEEKSKGIEYVSSFIYVYYDDLDDTEFYISHTYYFDYDSYDNAKLDFENIKNEYESENIKYEFEIEENIDDRTGTIRISNDGFMTNGNSTVRDYIHEIQDLGADECQTLDLNN